MQGPGIKAEPPVDSPSVNAAEGPGAGDQMDVDGCGTEIPTEKSTVLKVKTAHIENNLK